MLLLLLLWHSWWGSKHDIDWRLVNDIERPLVLLVGEGTGTPLIYVSQLVNCHSLTVVVVSFHLLSRCHFVFLRSCSGSEFVGNELKAFTLLMSRSFAMSKRVFCCRIMGAILFHIRVRLKRTAHWLSISLTVPHSRAHESSKRRLVNVRLMPTLARMTFLGCISLLLVASWKVEYTRHEKHLFHLCSSFGICECTGRFHRSRHCLSTD